MSDTVKRMDRAEINNAWSVPKSFSKRERPRRRLEEYLQILTADPTNDSICQMAADLSLSLQQIPQAVTLLGDCSNARSRPAMPPAPASPTRSWLAL